MKQLYLLNLTCIVNGRSLLKWICVFSQYAIWILPAASYTCSKCWINNLWSFWYPVDPSLISSANCQVLSYVTSVHLDVLMIFLIWQFIREGFISCRKGLFVLSPVGQVHRIWKFSEAACSACDHLYQHSEISHKESAQVLWEVYQSLFLCECWGYHLDLTCALKELWHTNQAVLTIILSRKHRVLLLLLSLRMFLYSSYCWWLHPLYSLSCDRDFMSKSYNQYDQWLGSVIVTWF